MSKESMETKKTLTEKLNSIEKIYKWLLAIVGIIGVCWSCYTAITHTITNVVRSELDVWYEEKIEDMFIDLTIKVEEVQKFQKEQIVKNILKQYDKIAKENFDDIKVEDLEEAIRYFPTLVGPEPNVIRAYQVILDYYYNTVYPARMEEYAWE